MPTTFTNQATLSYNNQSIPSNVVTGVLTEEYAGGLREARCANVIRVRPACRAVSRDQA